MNALWRAAVHAFPEGANSPDPKSNVGRDAELFRALVDAFIDEAKDWYRVFQEVQAHDADE